MSETKNGTPAAQLNAAQAAARVAQAVKINAETKPAPARKPSAATRKANASAAKPAARKPAATKPAAVKVARKPAGPSATSLNRDLATMIIKAAADVAATRKLPAGMTREDAIAQVGRWMSYLPGTMDARLTAIAAGGRRKVA